MYRTILQSTFVRALSLGVLVLTVAAAPAAAQTASNGDIVLHAKRATVMSGSWSLVADSSAADGLRLSNPDAGAAKVDTPYASPTNYFDMRFTPQAGRPYRLWIRGKAQNDSWTNDSVFVQFSGSLTSTGSAIYRTGTASATVYSLEGGSGMGEAAWGWQDNGYGGYGDLLYFDGYTQTIRVQTREDGLSIDQIILSPVAYASSAPGAAKYDTTIIAEPGTTSTSTTTTTTSTSSSSFAWANLVRASASGASVQKTSGCGDCADAGAVGTQQMTSGTASFTVAPGNRLVVGLGRDTSANTSYLIDYAFSFSGGSAWEIRESGTYRTEGPFSASDVFSVSIVGTSVKYYRNGSLVYTSGVAVSAPLVVDTSLITVGATATIVTSSGTTTSTTSTAPTGTAALTWTGFVNSTASGSTLKKSGGCGDCADAGGVSQQKLTSGAVAFSVPAGQRLVVGLNRDASTNTSYVMDYAFNFGGGSTWEIREQGGYRTEGPFSASDVFKVSMEGTTVKYYRNGSLVYTSGTPISAGMIVDASLITSGAYVQVSELSGSTTTSTTTTTTTTSPPPTTTTTSSTSLRVLQWNTHHGGYGTDNVYSPDRLANWIVYMRPDVVLLNEIEKYTGWGNQDQPEVYKSLLQQKTGKTWYYVFAQEFGQWTSNGKGNLILSTYPISYATRYELVHNYDRSIAMATVTVNGRPITLINTHLDPYDQTLRLTQAQEVTYWASPQPENRIITGDMNAWPDQTSIAQFNSYYYDSWVVAASMGTATAFYGNNGETKNGRIDYIFYSKGSPNLAVTSSQVYDTRDANGYMPSDHRPVLTTFAVR